MKLDLAAEKGTRAANDLAHCAERAFRQSLDAARAGNSVREISGAVEREVRRRDFHVIRELGGHGIGRTIHEDPSVRNFPDPFHHSRLAEGMMLTIEPIIAAGTSRITHDADKWTLPMSDGSLAAHYEHTLVVTRGEPIVLTTA